MNEIKEYRIETSNNPSDLRTTIDSYINDGRAPFGGVSVAIYENRDRIFAQAMVKYKNKEHV